MQLRNSYIFLVFFISPFIVTAQKDLRIKDNYLVTITTKDSTIKAGVLYGPKTIPTKNDVMYYWYMPNKIMVTQGAYQGRLLNGEYNVILNSTKNLKEKGTFENGVKDGEWITWYNNGLIKEQHYWKNGRLNGSFKKYNSAGKLIKEGKYSNNTLNGTIYEYKEGKIVSMRKYKKGIDVTISTETPVTDTLKAAKAPAVKPKRPTAVNRKDSISKKTNAKPTVRGT